MPETSYAVAAIIVVAMVTWALRALPFAALARLRASKTVEYLSKRMPAGVMIILLVYCLRDVSPVQLGSVAPLAALAVTIALHLWRRNILLSITGGTVVNVVLSSFAFTG